VSIADLHGPIPGIGDVTIVGTLRLLPLDLVIHRVRSARKAGLRVVEVTLDSKAAVDQIRTLTNEVADCTVGVGSVRQGQDIVAAVRAGARPVVSPFSLEWVERPCGELGVPDLPGAATPTETHTAHAFGATEVKTFPAEQLGGPPFLRAVASPSGSPY
jgi:2-dehydro-3-deoxyphosphogluconate aldolase / (4S)-4-hydroxy-2-oxoglutarate aldolase